MTEIPIVDNSFSLPQNVFETALASQSPVSITTSSSAGFASRFVNNPAAAHGIYTGQPQRRRTSGELHITEFTGSEAKRRRFSSVQMFALEMENRNRKRELVKQQIMERIDRTKDNIVKLLKMQHMQDFLQYYEKSEKSPSLNQTDNPANCQRNEPQYHSSTGPAYETQCRTPLSAPAENDPRSATVAPKRNVCVTNNMQGAARDVNRLSHLPPPTQRLRHVPGINIVMDGTQQNKQNTSYSCKSYDSVGLAWDHQTLPKIVAVHSVMKDGSVNTTKSESAPPPEPTTAAQIPSSYNPGQGGAPDYSQQPQQTQMRPPVMSLHCDVNSGTAVASDSRDHDDAEVVVTKVIPGKVRRSRSTQQKPAQTNLASHSEHAAEEIELSLKGVHVKSHDIAKSTIGTGYENIGTCDRMRHTENHGNINHPEHSEHSGYIYHSGQVDYSGQINHSGQVNYSGQNDHSGHFDYMVHSHHPENAFNAKHVEQMGRVDHPGYDHRKHLYNPGHVDYEVARTDCSMSSASQTTTVERRSRVYRVRADSELYLGGPPPYLPVLDSSELAELEKQRTLPLESRERRSSSPTSPKLTKTIPEISAKIIETRERMKNETIDWKKKILYKLETRLIRKLRRVERETGEKTEIEDLCGEAPAKESRKEKKSQSFDRRSSGTDSVTDDDEDDVPRGSKASGHLHEQEKGGKLGDIQEDTSRDEQHEEERNRPSTDNKEEDNDALMDNDSNSDDVPTEKYEKDSKQFETLSADADTNEHLKISTETISDEKVEELSKNLCNSLKEEKSTPGESTNKPECVTNELSQETELSSEVERTSAKETFDAVSAEVEQSCKTEKNTSTELSKLSHDQEKSTQGFQTKEDCVTMKSNANKKPEVKTGNIFEVFSPRSQAFHLLEKKPSLPETTRKSSVTITGEDKHSFPAETKKPEKRDTKVLANLKSLKKRLQICSKEVHKKKAETVSCERNIWSILRKNGVF